VLLRAFEDGIQPPVAAQPGKGPFNHPADAGGNELPEPDVAHKILLTKLISDLRGFRRLVEAEPVAAVEHLLDALDVLTCGVAREFGGTIRYIAGDTYCVTYPSASLLIAAAERLRDGWEAEYRARESKCSINVALHRGRICVFRSFLYGDGVRVALRVQEASQEVLADSEGGVFVTSLVRDNLSESPWYSRLKPVALARLNAKFRRMEVYRLGGS
jgi:class 3 adenylate cyclase